MAENLFYHYPLGFNFNGVINALSMCSQKIKLLLASERSERDTIRGNKWKSEIYIYIYIYMVRARHFSSAGPVLRYVGGVKCQ